MQFVAVAFAGFDDTNKKIVIRSEKVYVYLDPFNCPAGTYALVHNGREFGLVKIYKTISILDDEALSRAAKPIIAPVSVDEGLITEAYTKLTKFVAQSTDARIMKTINKMFDPTPKITATEYVHPTEVVETPDYDDDDDDDDL